MTTAVGNVASPFKASGRPRERNWFERLLGIARPELAELAFENLFANESPFEVGESRVTDILQRYRALGKKTSQVTRRIWSRALEAFLTDNHISDQEIKYLERLSRLLDVGFDDVEAIKAELVHPRYQRAVADAVADGVITKEEREFLEALETRLRLPPDLASRLAHDPVVKVVTARMAEMMSDRRLSPDELESIARLGSDLNTNLSFDDGIEAQISRYAELWRIENREIPAVPAPINLQKSETCHFSAQCEWWEMRSRTARIDYAGPVASIRIAKGLRFRIGSVMPSRVTTDELTMIDAGTVYFTNKRVILDGSRKNTSVRLSALIGIEAYSDAIVLEKGSGRSPHLLIRDADLEKAAAILTTLMATE